MIIKRLDEQSLIIVPRPSDEYISGATVDLRLNNIFLVPRQATAPYFDVSNPLEARDYLDTVVIPIGESFIIHPGEFTLGSTYEYLEIPDDVYGKIEGRSSLGRLGVIVHATAGKVDPGFRGRLIFEISNLGKVPVALYPLMRVAAMEFHVVVGKVLRPYTGKYLAQPSTTGTKIFLDKDISAIIAVRKELENKKRERLKEIWGKDITERLWVSKYGLVERDRNEKESQAEKPQPT
jgi:dCTP deaminase